MFVIDEWSVAQDGRSTTVSRTCHNELLVTGEHGTVEQSSAVDYDQSTVLRAAKTRDLTGVQDDGRHTESERSIYDHAPEHCYANVEKDENGRLLNRDTLAFRTSDFDSEVSSTALPQSNGQDALTHLVDMSTLRRDHSGDVPIVIHHTNKGVDMLYTNSLNHRLIADRTQSDATTEHVPYHTGRSVFYQRVDSNEGTLRCV